LPKAAVWVGNPVRESIEPVHTNSSDKINVLIIGGSQGAHSFNVKLPAVFAAIDTSQISIWHQSGSGRDTEVIESYSAQNVDAIVNEFIDDMAGAYAWADMLICRSGAMTVAECCAAAKPALLVPYPFSAGDHQEKNALAMVNASAGKMVLNHQLDQQEFKQTLCTMLRDKEALREMGRQAHTLHKPDALKDVVAVCQEYLSA